MRDLTWIDIIAKKIKEKGLIVAQRNLDNIPYRAVNGRFNDMSKENISWWTNGFWGGLMWQLYNGTHNELFKEIAERNENKLDAVLMEAQGLDHDNGFKWLPTSVTNYRVTGNKESRNRAILAANNLAGRYNLKGSFIRAWNDYGDDRVIGWGIIDCMMNLPLLYWASKESKDPRFRHIAINHADTVIKHFIREDGSVKHIVEFNPETGEYIKSHGGQGYDENSSWTRGQSWALYGFVLSYIHTREQRFLDTARRVADYIISQIPDSGLIPVDFKQPDNCSLEDSTASAIISCGLIELSKHLSIELNPTYFRTALKLIDTLNKERCNWDNECDNFLERCTAAFHDREHEFSIIYGDYFFIEAIWKLTEEEIFIW